jgi:hypothetical protein
MSEAPTVTAAGSRAGLLSQASLSSLPAATTTWMPASVTARTASSSCGCTSPAAGQARAGERVGWAGLAAVGQCGGAAPKRSAAAVGLRAPSGALDARSAAHFHLSCWLRCARQLISMASGKEPMVTRAGSGGILILS